MKLSYELLRGRLALGNGAIITESGVTDDPEIIRELCALAEVKDALGNPQYVRILSDAPQPEVNAGVVKADEAPVTEPAPAEPAPEVNAGILQPGEGAVIDPTPTEDTPAPEPIVLKYPAGVHENDVKKVQEALDKAGLTFEAANALSDDDIKDKTVGIGDARIKLIRAVGKTNGYAEYTAPQAPAEE